MGRFGSEAKWTSRLWSAGKEWWLGGLVVGGVHKKNKGVLNGRDSDKSFHGIIQSSLISYLLHWALFVQIFQLLPGPYDHNHKGGWF